MPVWLLNHQVIVSFPFSNFCLIVDSCFHPSRALTRSLEAFTPSTWTYFCYAGIKIVFGNFCHRQELYGNGVACVLHTTGCLT